MAVKVLKRPAKTWLVLPDAHYPYQEQAAMNCVFHVAEHLDPDGVLVLGDWADCEAFSSHPKKTVMELSAHRFLDDEIAPLNDALDRLQGPGLDRPLVYLEGNHEQRIERVAVSMGSAVGRDLYKLVSPRKLFFHRVGEDGEPREKRKNFKWVPHIGKGTHSHYALRPDLIAVHGWSTAKNAAKTHLDLGRSVSVVHGHTHRRQTFTARHPVTDALFTAWSPGCLSQLKPLFMANSPNDWAHGFTILHLGKNSWSHWDIPIHPGGWCVLPDGTEIKG